MSPFDDIVKKAAEKYQVPPELIDSIIKHESSGRVGAIGPGFKSNGTIKHAYGLMQIHQDNFAKYGVKDWKNPEQNIDAGARLLSEYHQQAGNWYDAVGYYNAGPTGWRRNKKGVMAQSPEYYKGIYSFLDEFTMKDKFIDPVSAAPAKADNTMRLIPVSPIQENTLKGMNDVKPVVNTAPVRMATEGSQGMDVNTLMQLYENPSLATDLNFLSSLPRLAEGGKNEGKPKQLNEVVISSISPRQRAYNDSLNLYLEGEKEYLRYSDEIKKRINNYKPLDNLSNVVTSVGNLFNVNNKGSGNIKPTYTEETTPFDYNTQKYYYNGDILPINISKFGDKDFNTNYDAGLVNTLHERALYGGKSPQERHKNILNTQFSGTSPRYKKPTKPPAEQKVAMEMKVPAITISPTLIPQMQSKEAELNISQQQRSISKVKNGFIGDLPGYPTIKVQYSQDGNPIFFVNQVGTRIPYEPTSSRTLTKEFAYPSFKK